MRCLLVCLLALAACDSGGAAGSEAAASSSSAQAGGGDGTGGESGAGGATGGTTVAGSTAATTGSAGGGGATSTSTASSSGSGGGDEGGGGAGGDVSGGAGGDSSCPSIGCGGEGRVECNQGCDPNDVTVVCAPNKCSVDGAIDLPASASISTGPVSVQAAGCSVHCGGAYNWFMRALVKPGECVKATGPIGSTVYMENPNAADPTCLVDHGTGCWAQTNSYGENTAIVLGIPDGMTTTGALFTVAPCDGVTECEPAGCNGAGG
jgi:hypothetical protein